MRENVFLVNHFVHFESHIPSGEGFSEQSCPNAPLNAPPTIPTPIPTALPMYPPYPKKQKQGRVIEIIFHEISAFV